MGEQGSKPTTLGMGWAAASLVAFLGILVGGGHGAGFLFLLYLMLARELPGRLGEPWALAALCGLLLAVVALFAGLMTRHHRTSCVAALLAAAGLLAAWWGWGTGVEEWASFLWSSSPFFLLTVVQVWRACAELRRGLRGRP